MATTTNTTTITENSLASSMCLKLSLFALQILYLIIVSYHLLQLLFSEYQTDINDLLKSIGLTLLTIMYGFAELVAIARENALCTYLFAIFDFSYCTGSCMWALIQCSLAEMPHLLSVAFTILLAVFAGHLQNEENKVKEVKI